MYIAIYMCVGGKIIVMVGWGGTITDVIIDPSDQPPCVYLKLLSVEMKMKQHDGMIWISQYIPFHCMNACVLIYSKTLRCIYVRVYDTYTHASLQLSVAT